MHAIPGSGHLLYEVHPRLSFPELSGGPRERQVEGTPHISHQLRCLPDIFPSETLHKVLTALPDAEASRHVILDAFAMLWSAKRIATSRAEYLPSVPACDARGFDMAIRC